MECSNPISKFNIIPNGKWFKLPISNHSDIELPIRQKKRRKMSTFRRKKFKKLLLAACCCKLSTQMNTYTKFLCRSVLVAVIVQWVEIIFGKSQNIPKYRLDVKVCTY